MELVVGKKYLTKNGSVAYIKYDSDKMGFTPDARPMGGTIIDSDGIQQSAFFTRSGIRNLSGTYDGNDIVNEIKEP